MPPFLSLDLSGDLEWHARAPRHFDRPFGALVWRDPPQKGEILSGARMESKMIQVDPMMNGPEIRQRRRRPPLRIADGDQSAAGPALVPLRHSRRIHPSVQGRQDRHIGQPGQRHHPEIVVIVNDIKARRLPRHFRQHTEMERIRVRDGNVLEPKRLLHHRDGSTCGH